MLYRTKVCVILLLNSKKTIKLCKVSRVWIFLFLHAHTPSFTMTKISCFFLKEGNSHNYGIIVVLPLNTMEKVFFVVNFK